MLDPEILNFSSFLRSSGQKDTNARAKTLVDLRRKVDVSGLVLGSVETFRAESNINGIKWPLMGAANARTYFWGCNSFRVKPRRDLVWQRVGDVLRFLSESSNRQPEKGSCRPCNADTSGVQSARRTRPWLCDNPLGPIVTRSFAERGNDSRALPALSQTSAGRTI